MLKNANFSILFSIVDRVYIFFMENRLLWLWVVPKIVPGAPNLNCFYYRYGRFQIRYL